MNLDPLRLLLMQSGTRLLFNTCDKIILNFKISWGGVCVCGGGGGIVAGEGKFQIPPPHPLPLYEILTNSYRLHNWYDKGYVMSGCEDACVSGKACLYSASVDLLISSCFSCNSV